MVQVYNQEHNNAINSELFFRASHSKTIWLSLRYM